MSTVQTGEIRYAAKVLINQECKTKIILQDLERQAIKSSSGSNNNKTGQTFMKIDLGYSKYLINQKIVNLLNNTNVVDKQNT